MSGESIEGPVLVSFASPDAVRDWKPVNDVVMGGLSSSRIRPTPEGTAVFEGNVSLENQGGFASVSAVVDLPGVSRFEGVAVRVRGDGRTYRLRLRMDDRFDGIAYQVPFATERDAWQIVRMPFGNFRASFRGQDRPDAEPLDPARIRQLGFLIGERQEGSFRLEIAWVRAYLRSG